MKNKFYGKFFTTNEIKPTGWMKEQLNIQARGLSGNLQKIWPDIKDSAWIGGNCDSFERVPYWLDGFIPLAYLLNDSELISDAKRYVYAIINSQQDDGWICPCKQEEREGYDIWAVFLICKALTVFYECSGEPAAIDAVYKAAENCYYFIRKHGLSVKSWAYTRWYEMFIALEKLQDIYNEEWIVDFGKLLYNLGMEYEDYTEYWKKPLNKWTFYTHTVNLSMMLKAEAVLNRLCGCPFTGKTERLYNILKKYNGTAVGTFTGDECLSGLSPVQGTELCSVVELMYSFERIFATTLDGKWLDRLEKAAFNALPATISDDMWTHQYDQQVNQIACIRFPGRSVFRTNGQDAHLFGLDPHFGCCTANFSQGWPKLLLSAFFKTQNGILCGARVPSKLSTEINGVPVHIELKTEYPFKHTLEYIIRAEKPVTFTLEIPLPRWAKKCVLNGKTVTGSKVKINKEWANDSLVLEFFDEPKLINRPERMKCVEYGPLVFSLPIDTEYKPFERSDDGFLRKYPYCDYELHPKSAWNYAFADSNFKVVESDGDSFPFSSVHPRLKLAVKMQKIDWDYDDGFLTVCRRTPKSRKAISPPETKTLYPYGCAKLRMTEMPIVNKNKN